MKLDKSKGKSFIYDEPWLSHPIQFYHGLYSEASHAGLYEGHLIYLSSPGCLCMGEEKTAYHAMREFFINTGRIPVERKEFKYEKS